MELKRTLNVAIITMAFLVAVSATAKTKHADDVLIGQSATVAGAHLTSGSYDIRWETHSPEATVTFLHGSKVVATAEGKVVDTGKKSSANEVLYDRGADGGQVIQEIRFMGSSEAIVFNQQH
ncbi:MAG: hypothetical protein ACLQVL_27365 [Terriglobia bacterium]